MPGSESTITTLDGRPWIWVECEVCGAEYQDHPIALPPHVCDGCDRSFGGDDE